MPGTIQVSVLDFKGLHSSPPSSQISIKVSIGKREYQTWDKGEFSFPLTTLRDNLIIILQDAEGNEISHTGVETKLVVEKGVWDDIFSLEGGGHVHMKLQFVLCEEEHRRIRIMRESALKKKHEELCNSGHGNHKSASVSYSEVSRSILLTQLSFSFFPEMLFLDVLSAPSSQGSQGSLFQSGLLANEASLVSVSFNDPKDAKFDIGNRDRSYSIQKQKSTDSVPSELEKANNSEKQGPVRKAHSHVRKMISAFEGRLNQDVKPSIKPPPKLSQTRKIEVDSSLANSHLNEVEMEKIMPPKVNADAGTTIEVNKDGQTSSQKLRPRVENSTNPEDSTGPVGQLIKVIIMVGFATLVLLTRRTCR
ncbi:uncharacterized protein LOC111284530 isoform X2 [Durio zibethinus]|nr:uncharacterized protein LOC111284530 isoform X2 [Durio zibethinus]